MLNDLQHALPRESVADGELIALDPSGRPDFGLLQNYASSAAPIVFFAFDLMRLDGENLTRKPLSERRDLLQSWLIPSERVQLSESFRISAERMLALVREHDLEGVVAKRLSSCYECGKRSGAWVKVRVEKAQEFVIGGYTPGTHGLDALLIGFYKKDALRFCASVRTGFVPASRRAVFSTLKPLKMPHCIFVNLPRAGLGRLGGGGVQLKIR